MRVTISVKGRFHAFYLAKELERLGALNRLITSYPKFETVKYGIERGKITSLILHEMIDRGWRKLPGGLMGNKNPQYLFAELFDRHATRKIPLNSDLFVGWSSFSLHSLRQANKQGIKTVLERGSSHILHQTQILNDEYEQFGLTPRVAHPKIVEKELKEYKETDYICVPSQYAKTTFLEQGVPGEKIIQVPFGVDLSNFLPAPKQDKVFRIIYCGRVTISKGVHYLLQAFSDLNLPNSELWLVGTISEDMKLNMKRYSSTNICYQGHVKENELYKYYSESSVFCFPSLDDGFGMVIVQAMACGLPVICTTNTGGKDIMRDGRDGIVVPIRDVEALKEKIVYLYENPDLRKEMGQSARKRVQSGFSWKDYGEKMLAEYEAVLSSPVDKEQRRR